MSTNWEKRSNIQSDYGAGLDEDLSRMTDEDGNVILFHNGEYYDADTEWEKRQII